MIKDVETFLIDRAKAALGTRVRGVESLPGDWDDEMFKRFAAIVPGVFVAFLGGGLRQDTGTNEPTIDSRWGLYCCTGHPTELARRHGDAMQIGAYTLLQVLMPLVHGLTMPGVGTFNLVDVQNLFTGTVERQALTVYALVFGLPMTMELVPDPALLTPFETFDAKYDVPPHTPAFHTEWLQDVYTGGSPDAHDTVALPQP